MSIFNILARPIGNFFFRSLLCYWVTKYPLYVTSSRSHLFKKDDGGLEASTITLLKLPQILVICIEKGGPNNFAEFFTILGNLYWKHCLIIKNAYEIHEIEALLGSNLNFTIRFFTWGLANDDNNYRKCSVQFDQ